ncbi:MAG: FHA domain-containing protein [Lentisphaeria bacterium]|nr:FHA domain-containing protein [Lentisphaeria bacterium]
MPSLDYILGNRKRHLELKTDTEYSIGRDSSCSICVGDIPKVSRRHSMIYFNSTINGFALADLGSSNGTFLNGRKIGGMDVPLRNGDKITIGPVELFFHSESADSPASIKNNTVKITMISRPAPFSPPEQSEESKHFRFRKGEQVLNDEKILEYLPSNDWAELYLTSSGKNELHLLKMLRELPQDPAAGKEMKRRIAQIPEIPGTVPVLNCGTLEDGTCFWLMNYLEYNSYEKMISMLSPLAQIPALALIYSAALILARSRKNNVFHGNLKPTKILYAPQVGNYIVGMGLSEWRECFFPDGVKRSRQWYAAPETSAGKSVWQSDQYALGIMLFQLLTGVLPFRAESSAELAAMHREKTMPLPQERNPQIHTIPAVDAILIRMTMKDPAARFNSWEELLEAMGKANSILKKQTNELI